MIPVIIALLLIYHRGKFYPTFKNISNRHSLDGAHIPSVYFPHSFSEAKIPYFGQ